MAPPPFPFLLGRDLSNQMMAPAPTDYTDPLLTTNLVCRVFFAILANLVCCVPLRLLYSNGEFAAVVLIVTVMTLNLLTVVNALAWRNDNLAAWWLGYGWCDFHNYFYNPLLLVYAACILAIMRNLARQLGTLRANAMTASERTRRNLVQALVIFPVPLIQLAWVFPLMMKRYAIGTLVGCIWVPAPSWPFIVFFVLPAPLMAIATGYYAVLVWKRFRAVQKTTKAALGANTLATARAHRARRRLFLMTLAILIPYLPIIVIYAVLNIIGTLPLSPFDFGAIHNRNEWAGIDLVPSDQLEFAFTNANYIPILTAVPIFWFFGMTVQAINLYRRYLVAVGLGRVFPSLKGDYDPDASLMATTTVQTETSTLGNNSKTPIDVSGGGSKTDSDKGEKKKQNVDSRLGLKSIFSRKTFGLPRAADFEGVSGQEIAAVGATPRRGFGLFGFRPAGNPFYPARLQDLRAKAMRGHGGEEEEEQKRQKYGKPIIGKPLPADTETDWVTSGRSHFQTRAWSDGRGGGGGGGQDDADFHLGNNSTDALSVRSGRAVVMTTRIDTTSETAQNVQNARPE